MNKLEDFPEQNRNCKSADHNIFLNGSGNFPEQIREISGTSGTLPEPSTVTIWPELFQVKHLEFQAFYLNVFKCVCHNFKIALLPTLFLSLIEISSGSYAEYSFRKELSPMMRNVQKEGITYNGFIWIRCFRVDSSI